MSDDNYNAGPEHNVNTSVGHTNNNYPSGYSALEANTTGTTNDQGGQPIRQGTLDDSPKTSMETLPMMADTGVSLPTIQSTFMEVTLSMGFWQPKKPSAKAKAKLQEVYGAYDKSVKPELQLLAYCKELSEAKSVGEKARTIHYGMSKPWEDGGGRILHNSKLHEWIKAMSESEQARDKMLNRFFDNYNEAVQNDQVRLGGLFKKGDYPQTVEEVKEKFYFTYSFKPITPDVRTAVFDDHREVIEEAYQKQHQKLIQDLTGSVWTTLKEQLVRLAQQCDFTKDDTAKRIFDGLADDVRDAVDALSVYNLADDPEMTRVYNELSGIINQDFNEEKIRRGESYRIQTRDQVQKVLDSLPSLSI